MKDQALKELSTRVCALVIPYHALWAPGHCMQSVVRQATRCRFHLRTSVFLHNRKLLHHMRPGERRAGEAIAVLPSRDCNMCCSVIAGLPRRPCVSTKMDATSVTNGLPALPVVTQHAGGREANQCRRA